VARPSGRGFGEQADSTLDRRAPLARLWTTVGHAGAPPKDRSRTFAVVAIALTLAVWIVLPLLVTISLAG
jgi:hypothetical protein